MCPHAFTADTNDYSLVTSLMRNKDAHKCARITLIQLFLYVEYYFRFKWLITLGDRLKIRKSLVLDLFMRWISARHWHSETSLRDWHISISRHNHWIVKMRGFAGTSSSSFHSKLNSYLVSWNIRFPTFVEARQWLLLANVSVFLWYKRTLNALGACSTCSFH